jgi:hypothetical protein
MINLHLCEPDNNWRKTAIINFAQGDIINCQLRMVCNMPHQLVIVFSSNFARWDILRSQKNWGIRLETETLDLAFVPIRSQVQTNGLLEFNLYSSSYLLSNEYLDNTDRFIDGDLATFLNQLSSNFTYTSTTASRDIKLSTGTYDNLELLTKSINYPDFYEWVDGGLKDTGGGTLKTDILYGNLGISDQYFDGSSDERLKPVTMNNFSNVYTDSTDNFYLSDFNIVQPNEGFTLLYPYVVNNQASSENSRIELTDPTASYINPQFPLVKRISPITGKVTYYIRNPYQVNYRERIKSYDVIQTANAFDENETQVINQEITEEILYRKAVSYIQATSSDSVLTINPIFKKIILPGTIAKVDFTQTIKNLDDSIASQVKIQENKKLDNLTFDLATIFN